jgi:Tfp pilus assembly protein PilV
LGLDDLPNESISPALRPGTSGGIGGPSFLGLDRDQASSSYLFEEAPCGHLRGRLLALIIVGLVVLGCLQWRTEMQNQAQKLAAMMRVRRNVASTQTKAWEPVVSAENTPPAPVVTFSPNTSGEAVGTTVTSTSSPATPAETSPTARNVAAAPSHADDSSSKTSPPAETRTEKPTASEEQSSRAGSPKRRHQRRAVADNLKFTSRPSAERANNILVQAQEYLHVRNCQQGMIYLQQAVRHRSPEALSQMGALYATGMCVQQNRVEAYNWFSSALNVDPGNPWLTRERHILYGEMTSTERRKIGR